MKKFGKGLIASATTAALLSTGLGTIGISAQDAAVVPTISGEWNAGTLAGEASGYNPSPNTANLSVDYSNAALSGKQSITAVYDASGKLIGTANGVIDAGGAANYALSVSSKDAAKVKNYVWDMTNLKPETAASEMAYADFTDGFTYKVPSFSKGSGYRVRSSFETESLAYFLKSSSNKANIEVTDEVPANTGTKSVKITNRNADYATLDVPIKTAEIGKSAKIVVNCYVRKTENTEKESFYIQAVVPKGSGKYYYPTAGWVNNVTDNDWHKVTAEFDLADTKTFANGVADGTIEIRVCASDNGDFYADDLSVVADNASSTVFYDDTKVQKLKWDFEDETTGATTNRPLNKMADQGKFTMTVGTHAIGVENTSDALFCNPSSTAQSDAARTEDANAVKTPADGSTKMLAVTNNGGQWAGGQNLATRVKISKLDLVPGKSYTISFWAYDNSEKRAVYVGLLPHAEENNPTNYCGSYKFCDGMAAPGIIQYGVATDPIHGTNGDYMVNYVASMPRSWHKYSVNITPKESDFSNNGFTALYFVAPYDRPSTTQWSWNVLHAKEKFYLDDVEIVENPAVPVENTGVYTKRASFENDTMDMFTDNESNYVTYTLVNDIPANTGTYCVRVTDRNNAKDTLKVSLKGVDSTSKITVSTYVKNYNYETKNTWYNFWLVYKDASGAEKSVKGPGAIQVKDSLWHKLTAVYDLSKYENVDWSTATVQLRTSTGSSDKKNYYADDFMVIADKAGDGTFYDDLTVNNDETNDTMSKTASAPTFRDGNDIENDITALYTKYQDKFKVGAAIANGAQTKSATYAKLFKKHFNAAVSDGYFKMPEILRNPDNLDEYTFTGADETAKFCLDNGINDITGHALIYDTAAVSSKYFYDSKGEAKLSYDDALEFMETYITRVMNHFNGKGDSTEYTTDYKGGGVTVWDVVNEAIEDAKFGLRMNFFGNTFGRDYVKYAFQFARNVDPTAVLRYNDYCSFSNEKAAAVKDLVQYVNADDKLIDRIGVQSHYHNDTDINYINKSLDIIMSTDNDMKIDITELDIRAYTYAEQEACVGILENGVTKAREYRQAKLLKDLFTRYEAMADAGRLDRVVFWTFADGYGFPNQEFFYHKDYAGLFDRQFKAKPQYYILTDTEAEFNARYPDYSQYIN